MAVGDPRTGYIVAQNLGANGNINTGTIGGDPVGLLNAGTLLTSNFTEATVLGTGSVTTGGLGVIGSTGTFYLGEDGSVYFIADNNAALANLSVLPIVTTYTGTNSFIYGSGANNTFGGTVANDVIYGGAAGATTGTGNDNLSGGGGNDVVYGRDGDDIVSGNVGVDTLYGGVGNDTMTGGAGADYIDGGAGTDTANYDTSTGAVQITIPGATGSTVAAGGDAAGDTLVGIENVIGSNLGDSITGGAGANTINGLGGDDTLSGGAGADALFGGAGLDVLFGGGDADSLYGGDDGDNLQGLAGSDLLEGGAGDDTLNGGTEADTIYGGTGNDSFTYTPTGGNDAIFGGSPDGTDDGSVDTLNAVFGSDITVNFTGNGAGTLSVSPTNTASFAQIEAINTGGGNDVLDAGATTVGVALNGNAGSDTLTGGAGADTLLGGADNDVLTGGAGADLLQGGSGDDDLNFGYGDAAEGNDGNDTFLYTAPAAGETPATMTVTGGAEDTTTGAVGDVLDLTATEGWRNTPSTTTPGSGVITLADGTIINYTGIEQVLCFTPGTMIRTLGGLRAIETLTAGDMVLTRDNGMQPIRWIGTTEVAGTGAFAPIRIRKGAVPDLTADLLVSPQHRMLVEGYRAELLFGEREVLASAKHMVDGKFVTVEEAETVTYIHMLFDAHEVVFANGSATESYHPASYGLGTVCEEAREELFAIFPELRSMPDSYGKTARRVLKAFEVNALAW